MKTGKAVKLYNGITNIKDEIIDEAQSVRSGRRQKVWLKRGAIAACFALIAVIGIGVMHTGILGNQDEIVTLNSGETLLFAKMTNDMGAQGDMPYRPFELTTEEVTSLFGDLPVTANAYYDEENSEIVGLEGEINGVKLVISKTGVNLIDTVADDSEEKTSEINGIVITAGYCTANNYGNKISLYYAVFELGGNTIRLENGGLFGTEEATAARDELISAMLTLIDNGEVDFSQIRK